MSFSFILLSCGRPTEKYIWVLLLTLLIVRGKQSVHLVKKKSRNSELWRYKWYCKCFYSKDPTVKIIISILYLQFLLFLLNLYYLRIITHFNKILLVMCLVVMEWTNVPVSIDLFSTYQENMEFILSFENTSMQQIPLKYYFQSGGSK